MEWINISDHIETLDRLKWKAVRYGSHYLYVPSLEGMCQKNRSNNEKLGITTDELLDNGFQPRLNIPAKLFRVGENVAPTRNARART